MLSNVSIQIPIGIVFVLLYFWRFLEYRKELNTKIKKDEAKKYFTKKIIIILIIGIICSIVLGIAFYEYNPIKNLENQNGSSYLSSYTYEFLRVFNKNIKYENMLSLSTFNSVFPAGLIIGLCYIFKDENKHMNFIAPTTIVSILELIYIVSNFTIPFIPKYIFVLGFNLLQVYMIIYFFSKMEEKLFSMTKSAYITLIALVFIVLLPVPKNLSENGKNIVYLIFSLESYIVLNYSDKRFWRLASWVFTIICLFSFISSIILYYV